MKKKKTIGELLKQALSFQTKKKAEEWFEQEVAAMTKETGKSENICRDILKENLGYAAGYYGNKEAKKIHQLYGAVHPVFGHSDYHLK